MSDVGINAIKALLAEKSNPGPHAGRLVIENQQIHFKNKNQISLFIRFQAKLGFGNASLSKIASKINSQRDVIFLSAEEALIKANFNDYLVTYNKKQTLCWKKAKKIQGIGKEIITGINLAGPLTNDQIWQLITGNFKKCEQAFANLKNDPKELIEACTILSLAFEGWEPTPRSKDKRQYREEKKLFNQILNFKNEVRGTCIDKGDKPLKGTKTSQNKLLNKEDQEKLKTELKEIQKSILKRHFNERLEKDGLKLSELRIRFEDNEEKGIFNGQETFLKAQIARWQKKLDEGKPIAIPKWYHCTKDDPTLRKILDTYILYMHKGAYPGCFVANLPEHGYGSFCIALSEHIEVTGTKNPKSKIPVYPNYSQLHESQDYPIQYSDTSIAPQDDTYRNNQENIGMWFGFQRGAHTLNRHTGFGTEGIPLKCQDRVKAVTPLHGFKDTTVAFIFNRYDNDELKSIAHQRRIQALDYDQEEALRSLINATFMCTLPKAWKNKLKQCRGRWW